MAWRIVVVGAKARLRVERFQLVIAGEDGERALPLEDVAVLLLESHEVSLTSDLLARLAEHDTLLLACDARHLPCMAALPLGRHSRLLHAQRLQLAASIPFKKRCWQAIVRRKIGNQALALRALRRDGADTLDALLPSVGSGDPANVEAHAAALYWHHLFGPAFVRQTHFELAHPHPPTPSPRGEGEPQDRAPEPVNAALNYGYAIVRGAMARALAAHGFLPALGLHHGSELNPFNLADDFLEPWRPLVDIAVARLMPGEVDFTRDHRHALVGVLGYDVRLNGEAQGALHAAEMMAASLLAACSAKDPALLQLPELLPPRQHRYE